MCNQWRHTILVGCSLYKENDYSEPQMENDEAIKNETLYQNIRKSRIHLVETIPTILYCAKMVSWMVEQANTNDQWRIE